MRKEHLLDNFFSPLFFNFLNPSHAFVSSLVRLFISAMAPREDLGALYAKHMEHFGCGMAMFQPVSATDMRPPCIGYLDDDRRWNLITNIEWLGEGGLDFGNTVQGHHLKPLSREPRKMEQLGIEWRPRTSIGVRQMLVDASGQTP